MQRCEQRVDVEGAVARDEQVVVFVASADHAWMVGAVVERALQQTLERRVLLFDDDHLIEALGELAGLGRIERHGHQQLEQAHAGTAHVVVGDEAEHSQRLSDFVERVTACGDADPVVGGAGDDSVQSVLDAVAPGERPADLLELTFHVDRVRRDQPSVRSRVERVAVDLDHRRRRVHPVGVHVDGARAVRNCRHQLESGPQTARP